MPTKPRGLDPRSDRIVLAYGGDESGNPHLSGVPARDLSEHDVCRLASTSEREPEAVLAELIASGLYAPAKEH